MAILQVFCTSSMELLKLWIISKLCRMVISRITNIHATLGIKGTCTLWWWFLVHWSCTVESPQSVVKKLFENWIQLLWLLTDAVLATFGVRSGVDCHGWSQQNQVGSFVLSVAECRCCFLFAGCTRHYMVTFVADLGHTGPCSCCCCGGFVVFFHEGCILVVEQLVEFRVCEFGCLHKPGDRCS